MMFNDSEYYTELSCKNSRENRSDGFQGCSHCDFGGYYLYQYSPEGLCSECEIKLYPERFYPCPICRRPQKFQAFCITCNIEKIIGFNIAQLHIYDFDLFKKISKWEQKISKMTLPGQFIVKIDEEERGFYLGDGVWKKLNFIPKMTENAIALNEPDPEYDDFNVFVRTVSC
jgi:hypothetical protein